MGHNEERRHRAQVAGGINSYTSIDHLMKHFTQLQNLDMGQLELGVGSTGLGLYLA